VEIGHCALNVLLGRHNFEVLRIPTGAHAAQVIDLHSFWNRTEHVSVELSVQVNPLVITRARPRVTVVQVAGVNPATRNEARLAESLDDQQRHYSATCHAASLS